MGCGQSKVTPDAMPDPGSFISKVEKALTGSSEPNGAVVIDAAARQKDRQQARREAAIAKLVSLYGSDATDPHILKYQTLLRGISLLGVKKLLAFVKEKFNAGFFSLCELRGFEDGTTLPPVTKFEDLTTTHVVYLLIKDPSITGEKRLADCPDLIDPADVGPPAYFISHAWKGGFVKTMQAVINYLSDASDATIVWLDIFAVNQHPDTNLAQNQADVAAFKLVLEASKAGTIVVVDVDKCSPALRLWCLYEWTHTINLHGPDGLHMTGMTGPELRSMVKTIDVEKASCYSDVDKEMIRSNIIEHHGTFSRFNDMLKLHLMLNPLSLKMDLQRLIDRSEGTSWTLDAVSTWMKDSSAARALVLMSGAGEGKSTISAAICHKFLGLYESDEKIERSPSPPIAAAHFLRFSDANTLDPVKMIKSIAFQLAQQLSALAKAILNLDALTLDQLTSFESAFDMLLAILSETESPIFILIDALDESDPLQQQQAGTTKSFKPVANRAVYVLTSLLIPKLPPNVRFIFTTRPDAMGHSIEEVLRRSFKDSIQLVKPSDLRVVSSDHQEGRVMVFDSIVNGCPHIIFGVTPACPDLNDTFRAYKVIWDDCRPSSEVINLLNVIVAAQEPLTMRQLSAMGLDALLEDLPGWGCLFYLGIGHTLMLIHKSLSDWLRDKRLGGQWAADEARGHALLGTHLLKEVTKAADKDKEGAPEVEAHKYALKYTVLHITKAMFAGQLDLGHLNSVLGSWPFLRQAFRSGHAGKLVQALGESHSLLSTREELSSTPAFLYAQDALYCFRRYFNKWEENPDEMEGVAMSSPMESFKFKEALSRLKPAWKTSLVLGGLDQSDWPADRMVLQGHVTRIGAGYVYSVSFSPDGKTLATGTADKTAKIWDLVSGQCTATLIGHSGKVWAASFDPGGKTLATGSGDKDARIWDLASGQCIASLQGHSDNVRSVKFSPDSKTLATGSDDKTGRIWDLVSGQCTTTLEGHSKGINSVAFSPDGLFLATGSTDTTLKIWELAGGQSTGTLEGHTGAVWAVSFSPDGLTLASGSWDCSARIWSLASGQCIAILQGHSDYVRSVDFSHDGKSLATGSDDKAAKIWDIASGQCTTTFRGHLGEVNSVSFSPDGKSIATGSDDMTARIWDLATPQCSAAQGHVGFVYSVAFSPDNKTLASGSADNTVRIWDLTGGQCTATFQGHTGSVWSVAFSPDGRSLATGSDDKTAMIWDVSSGRCIASLQGHTGSIYSVAFSRDAMTLGTGSFDKTARIWDLASGQCTTTFEGHSDRVWAVAFSPVGEQIFATGSGDKTARIWDLSSGQCTITLEGHTDEVNSVAFSPDGRTLGTGSLDHTARIWDLSSRQQTGLFAHPKPPLPAIQSVAFSPDGRTLATGSHDHTARIWDLASGLCTATLQGHSGGVWEASFSPDGKMLATGSADYSARIWHLA